MTSHGGFLESLLGRADLGIVVVEQELVDADAGFFGVRGFEAAGLQAAHELALATDEHHNRRGEVEDAISLPDIDDVSARGR